MLKKRKKDIGSLQELSKELDELQLRAGNIEHLKGDKRSSSMEILKCYRQMISIQERLFRSEIFKHGPGVYRG